MSESIDNTVVTIRNVFDPVFDLYRNIYLRIFELLYPAFGSTGFTERNQTVNFSKAYETLHPGAFTWFEMPFSKRLHLDAIIIDPAGKTMLFIESKRFSNVTAKVASVAKDVQRINRAITDESCSISDRVKGYGAITKHYGVILGDVWTETNEKIAIYDSFKDNEFPTKYLAQCGIASDKIPGATCFARNFKNVTEEEAISTHYILLGMIWNAPVS